MNARRTAALRLGAMALLAAAAFAACTTDERTAGIDRGGVRAPVAASGPITAFGSIFVNGVRFDVASAQIDVNGATAAQADLAIGQIVAVTGELDEDGLSGTAMRVVFESNVTGPVESVDVPGRRLVVLGQTVLTTDATLDPGSRPAILATLHPGDAVEVSGYTGSRGWIVANLIRLVPAGDMRVRGRIDALDTAAKTFAINALTVDYGSAGLIEGFPGGEPVAGDGVVAVGAALDSDGSLIAARLERYEVFRSEEGDAIEVEDLINRFVAPDDFDVSDVRVRATDGTEYEGGSAADLQLNVKIQVEGFIAPDGVLEARKIEVKDGGRVYDN